MDPNNDQTNNTPVNQKSIHDPEITLADDKASELDKLTALESLINTFIAKLDRLKNDAKPLKEMVDSYLNNDEEYTNLTNDAKEATRKKSARKKQLMDMPNGKELLEKMINIKDEVMEANDALSTYLKEYHDATGADEFEGQDGELRQIVYNAKLVRKTNLNK